ncbi:hypothetical protein Hanom_Chr09g00762091 [Helianthus anomalus]
MDISSDNEPSIEIPVEDDVLAVGPQLNQFVIIGHPDGAHIVDYIPLDVVPLAAVPGDIVVSDDEDDVPVIHAGHPDDEIDDGEVLDIAILEVFSPVVSVINISSSDVSDDASSTNIYQGGLHADAADSSFDTIPIATQSPDHALASISAPVDTPTVAPLNAQTPHTTLVTLIPGCPLTPPTTNPHYVDLPTIFSHEIPAPRPGEGTS